MSSVTPHQFSAEIESICAALERPLVFVDLETTGGNAATDRITEVGVVEISREGVSTWTTLVDPQQPIPEFIERLTGIDNTMVQGAPRFDMIAVELAQRLKGRLFAAHNARFDYGFLKNEFQRAGVPFSADVLCTVRLSRALFPAEKRHGLDALIERHALQPSGRHRALSDADLLWQFWQKLYALRPAAAIQAAVTQLVSAFSLPTALDQALLDNLPAAAGIYIFYGEKDVPLYVGKSRNLKRRVSAHFVREKRPARDLKLALQVRRVECVETGGELGTLLRHAQLVSLLAPQNNKKLRRGASLCAWRFPLTAEAPRLVHARDYDFAHEADLFGLFMSRREAETALGSLADQHQLCRAGLGLEKSLRPGAPCSAYLQKRCGGACVGAESGAAQTSRARLALEGWRVQSWPYAGPVLLTEDGGAAVRHLVQDWNYLGSVAAGEDLDAYLAAQLAARTRPPAFEHDTYLLLRQYLQERRVNITPLAAATSIETVCV